MRLLKQSSVLNSSTSPGLAVAHGLLSFENTVTWSVITCMMLILSLAAWHREVAPRGYRGLSACDADADEAILHLIGIAARIASAWGGVGRSWGPPRSQPRDAKRPGRARFNRPAPRAFALILEKSFAEVWGHAADAAYGRWPMPPSSVMVSPLMNLKSGPQSWSTARPISISTLP